MMAPGMKKGEILRGPFFSKILSVSSISGSPPIPEPIFTPIRSALSGCLEKPASSSASIPAARP